jgi:hypothetical protein
MAHGVKPQILIMTEHYSDEHCDRCGNERMRKMTECHLICENCGSHLDCSDKGTVW